MPLRKTHSFAVSAVYFLKIALGADCDPDDYLRLYPYVSDTLQPMNLPFTNRIEIINDCTILLLLYG